MRGAARHLLQTFEALSETERREVMGKMFRRAADPGYAFPSDDELVQSADEVFEELDRHDDKG